MRAKDFMLRLQRFKRDETRRQVLGMETMIRDFLQKQKDLELQIFAEEVRGSGPEAPHLNHSMTTRALSRRKQNLDASISELKAQLEECRRHYEQEEKEFQRLEALSLKTLGIGKSSNRKKAARG